MVRSWVPRGVSRQTGRSASYEGRTTSPLSSVSFNPTLRIEFQGARVNFDGGLILVRELDERLGLSNLIAQHITDPWGRGSAGVKMWL
jgi:hypothetical protein